MLLVESSKPGLIKLGVAEHIATGLVVDANEELLLGEAVTVTLREEISINFSHQEVEGIKGRNLRDGRNGGWQCDSFRRSRNGNGSSRCTGNKGWPIKGQSWESRIVRIRTRSNCCNS